MTAGHPRSCLKCGSMEEKQPLPETLVKSKEKKRDILYLLLPIHPPILPWYSLIGQSFPGGSDGKASACNAGDPDSLSMEDPLEKEMVGYTPWGHNESDTNE